MFDTIHTGMWIAFGAVVLILLAIDLGVANRHAHKVGLREAAIWSVVWIALSLVFNGVVYFLLGSEDALAFLTGYLIEKSLSVDNLFVFLVIFKFFRVAAEYQHRVLFWGVIGAIVLRIVMITAGVALVAQFHWLLYVFGAFLVYTAVKLAMSKDEPVDPNKNLAVRLARKLMHIAPGQHGERFWVRIDGKRMATSLLLVLITVELSDVMFALDSIPAIFGITEDAFILITSNVFAILGLRALFFLLAGFMEKFHYLSAGLSLVLGFIGVKMLIARWVYVPTEVSLGVVGGVLATAVVLSLMRNRRLAREGKTEDPKPEDAGKDNDDFVGE